MCALVVAALGTLGAAAVQSGVGFGFALILAPVMVVVMPAQQGFVLVLALGVVLNLLVLFGERRPRLVAWGPVRPVLAAALPRLVTGAVIVGALPKTDVQILTGAAVLAAACLQVRAAPRPDGVFDAGTPAAVAVGVVTGVFTTATSVSGPLLVIWLRHRRLGGGCLRDSLNAAFLILNLGGAAALSMLGSQREHVGHLVWLLALGPAVIAGHAAGRFVFDRMSPRRHELAVLGCVLLASVVSLASGAIGLAQR